MAGRTTLGELCDIDVGPAFPSGEFRDDPVGPRLLRGDNVAQGRLRWDKTRFWPRQRCDGFERYALREGDVIVAMDRPWIAAGLKQATVRETDLPALLVQRVARLRARAPHTQAFLRWLVASPAFTTYIRSVSTGSTIPHISQGQIADFPVDRVPLPAEQRGIAGVLGALDDKIESNRRMTDAIGQVIRLELDHCEGADWPHVPVSSLARFVNGGAYTKDATGTGRMVIRIAELNKGAGSSTVYNDLVVPDDRTARAGDLMMSWSGSLGVHVWTGEEAIINQHIFKVVPTEYPHWLVDDRLQRVIPEFRRIAADKATTMGHIKRHHLDETTVRVPGAAKLGTLDKELGPLWQRRLSAELESQTLAALRDALLPELLSGRLRVPEAEDLVADAG